jgi:hypothetical protein
METTKKKIGDINPNGLYYMDRETWDSIWRDLTKIREQLEHIAMKKDFSLFHNAHFSIATHDGEIITDSEPAGKYFAERNDVKIMITDISFKPIFYDEAQDIHAERIVKESTDFLITVQFAFMDAGSISTGAGTLSRRHIDVCVTDP